MSKCVACGRSFGMSAPPCPSCPDAPPAAAPAVAMPRPVPMTSRWASSDTTFGPVGRMVATAGLLLPLGLFVFTLGSGFGLVGAVIWGGIIVPWGLRDVWRPARRR